MTTGSLAAAGLLVAFSVKAQSTQLFMIKQILRKTAKRLLNYRSSVALAAYEILTKSITAKSQHVF